MLNRRNRAHHTAAYSVPTCHTCCLQANGKTIPVAGPLKFYVLVYGHNEPDCPRLPVSSAGFLVVIHNDPRRFTACVSPHQQPSMPDYPGTSGHVHLWRDLTSCEQSVPLITRRVTLSAGTVYPVSNPSALLRRLVAVTAWFTLYYNFLCLSNPFLLAGLWPRLSSCLTANPCGICLTA